MRDLKKLYTDIIRQHNDSPYHFRKMEISTFEALNPICGDRFEFYVGDRQQLNPIHFHGFGCAISTASSSIMIKSVEGKTRSQALALCNQFLDWLRKDLGNEQDLPDQLMAFSGVHAFPERFECASLCWQEMKKFLETGSNFGG